MAGRGCLFPLDGDKRLPVPSGSPRGHPAPPKAPPWVQLSGTFCPASFVAPRRSRDAFDTRRQRVSSSQVQSEDEKFYLWLVEASAAKNLSEISSKHPVGAQRRGKQARKAIKCVPKFPSPSQTSPVMWSEQWPMGVWHGKGDSKKETTKKANLLIPGLGAAQNLLNSPMSHWQILFPCWCPPYPIMLLLCQQVPQLMDGNPAGPGTQGLSCLFPTAQLPRP